MSTVGYTVATQRCSGTVHNSDNRWSVALGSTQMNVTDNSLTKGGSPTTGPCPLHFYTELTEAGVTLK